MSLSHLLDNTILLYLLYIVRQYIAVILPLLLQVELSTAFPTISTLRGKDKLRLHRPADSFRAEYHAGHLLDCFASTLTRPLF